MSIQALAFLFVDSDTAAILNSAYVVPVAGCVMIASISVAGVWSGVRNREIRSQERLAMIAQGLQPEPEWSTEQAQQLAKEATADSPMIPKTNMPSNGGGSRRAGYILSSIGIGLFLFFVFLGIVLRDRDTFSGAASGILPLAIGIGFLADARTKRRDYERWMDRVFPRMGAYGAGLIPEAQMPPMAGTGTQAAPPPPVGMSAAQASDWRPLH